MGETGFYCHAVSLAIDPPSVLNTGEAWRLLGSEQ